MTRHHAEPAIPARWPQPEPSRDGVADSGPGGGETSEIEENDLAAAPNDLIPLYRILIEADDRGDAATLARVGWILFATASKAQQTQREALVLLMELRAAAGAVSAGDGSRASLALLRHVLSKHGWLPPPHATPLQVLAGSYPPVSSRFPS
jgi:hypothetical protein